MTFDVMVAAISVVALAAADATPWTKGMATVPEAEVVTASISLSSTYPSLTVGDTTTLPRSRPETPPTACPSRPRSP